MNKTVIIKGIIMITLLALIYNFGFMTGESKRYADISSMRNSTYTDNTISIFDRTQVVVNSFIEDIKAQKFQEAFDMLSSSCQLETFHNSVESFKNVMTSKIFDATKAEKEYQMKLNNGKSIYRNDSIHAYYEIYIYSLNSYSLQAPSETELDDEYYFDRDLLIDVVDKSPYEFELSITIKEYSE